MLEWVKNKIRTMILRFVVTDSLPHKKGNYLKVQNSSLGKISYLEIICPYGFISRPPENSLGVKWNVQGEGSNQVGMAYDPTTLPSHNVGETVVGAFSAPTATYLKFTQQGTIEVWKSGQIVISDLITHVHTGVEPGGGTSEPPAP